MARDSDLSAWAWFLSKAHPQLPQNVIYRRLRAGYTDQQAVGQPPCSPRQAARIGAQKPGHPWRAGLRSADRV